MQLRVIESKDPHVIAKLNETVQKLHKERYPEKFKEYDYNLILTAMEEIKGKDDWFSYIAYDGEKPVGYILFYIREYLENPFRYSYKGIHIDQLCITDEYQGCGIGTALLKIAENRAKEIGASQIELTFWDKNIEAKEFYMKKGFAEGTHFVIKNVSQTPSA
jgi:GNAT superfamily N-acetyltransferase